MTNKATKTGKELEHRVAHAYRTLSARTVEHDVELAGHQIDVYVELEMPDHGRHRIAVEAKDYASTVGIEIATKFLVVVEHLCRERLIDEGVIVSATGFSREARKAAQASRIRLLELADLERNAIAHHLVEKYRESEDLLADLLDNRLTASYLREAAFDGPDMEQLLTYNRGAMLECVMRRITERDSCRLSCKYGHILSPEETCRLLTYLGWYMFCEDRTDCNAADAARVAKEALAEIDREQDDVVQVLDWLAATYWFRKTRRGIFEFRDSYIVNGFAAMELKGWFSTGRGPALLGLGLADDPARWQRVIVLLAGMLPQDHALELIEVLLKERLVQLAGWCMCIFEGQSVPKSTVEDVTYALLRLLAEVERQ